MAHFAKLDEDNIVISVHVVNNDVILDENGEESEQKGIEFLTQLHGHGHWRQCSYNGNFRKRMAGENYFYDTVRNAFIGPKSYNSWVWNEDELRYDPPVPFPNVDTNLYVVVWDEENVDWSVTEAVEPEGQ